jgi:hypothetical protein
MQHPVTPWAATVPEDIESGELLLELLRFGYTFRLVNAGDSIWLAVTWPNANAIAFRLAFGMNSVFDRVDVNNVDEGILVTASTRLAFYRIMLSFPVSDKHIFRYTTTFRIKFPMLIPYWPRDIVPVTKDGRLENTAGKIYARQEGGRSGQLFFSYTRPVTGSVFYFQNLTAMSEYCDVSQTTLVNRVGGQWPEIGFEFPVNKDKPLPANREFVIGDAFVLTSDRIPETAMDVTEQYLDYLAAVYLKAPRPGSAYQDWQEIARKSVCDLYRNKGCWTQTAGIPYLNAYVCDYKTPSEIMVQLAVLLPLIEYLEWAGTSHPLFDDLNKGLAAFYDDRVKSIVRWHPALEDELDKSEEQKREMVMDSWYLHHPLLNLSRLALKGDKIAEKLFLDSIDFAIKVAHHFNYDWPVFYKMTTLEVLKAETEPGKGGEKDVPGSYAHIMLMAWKLTGEKRFWNEAVKAVKKMEKLTFDVFYQANNTAFTATTLLEMYRETGDDYYLKLSYTCLAGIFRNAQLWDCNYGFGKHVPNFFAVFPLKDAPYTAAYEELEVYAALDAYIGLAAELDILPSLKVLLPEFVRYAVGRMPFYYPPMLPEEMITDDVKTGEIKKDLWVPLEDIHDGWEKSGEVGQEVYGAGIGFGVVPRQYRKVPGTDLVIFVDYSIQKFRTAKGKVTLHVYGSELLTFSLRLLGVPKNSLERYKVEARTANAYERIQPVKKGTGEFRIKGNAMVRISWK